MTWLNDAEVILPLTQQEKLDAALASAIDAQRDAAQHYLDQLVSPWYPAKEVATFGQQREEAKQVLAGNVAGLDMLPGHAAQRGETVEVLADKIMSKASQYAAASGLICGARQAIEKEIKAAHAAGDLTALQAFTKGHCLQRIGAALAP